jgi:hypothetical protein
MGTKIILHKILVWSFYEVSLLYVAFSACCNNVYTSYTCRLFSATRNKNCRLHVTFRKLRGTRFLCITIHPQSLALTSPTSGGCSVGIFRLRTTTTGYSFCPRHRGWGSPSLSPVHLGKFRERERSHTATSVVRKNVLRFFVVRPSFHTIAILSASNRSLPTYQIHFFLSLSMFKNLLSAPDKLHSKLPS